MDSKKEQIVEEVAPASTLKSEKPKVAKKPTAKSTAKATTKTTAKSATKSTVKTTSKAADKPVAEKPAAKSAAKSAVKTTAKSSTKTADQPVKAKKTTTKKSTPKPQNIDNGNVVQYQQWYQEPSETDKILNFLKERWYVILIAIGIIITNFVISAMLDFSDSDYEYEQSQYDNSSSYSNESSQTSSYSDYKESYSSTPDYSWLYGTWVATDAGDKHIVSFAENGLYIEKFQSSYGGSSSGCGSFSISNGRIRLDAGDGYPAYMDIDESRKLIRSDNIYYRKRY